MKNELFDKFFGPPMNMPVLTPIPKSDGINFVLIGGGVLILLLLYKLNSQKKKRKRYPYDNG